jgi:hypothetical protein
MQFSSLINIQQRQFRALRTGLGLKVLASPDKRNKKNIAKPFLAYCKWTNYFADGAKLSHKGSATLGAGAKYRRKKLHNALKGTLNWLLCTIFSSVL